MGDPPQSSGALTAEGFGRLLECFQVRLVRFVCGIVGNGEDARDIVQDVFADAWRAAQRRAAPFAGEIDERAVRRWLFRTAYYDAVSALRHRNVLAWDDLDVFDSLEALERRAPESFEDRLADGEALGAALARLEPQDVACLRLSIVEGFSAVEIAQILGIHPDAARKRLSRATQRLRAAYLAREAAVRPAPHWQAER